MTQEFYKQKLIDRGINVITQDETDIETGCVEELLKKERPNLVSSTEYEQISFYI